MAHGIPTMEKRETKMFNGATKWALLTAKRVCRTNFENLSLFQNTLAIPPFHANYSPVFRLFNHSRKSKLYKLKTDLSKLFCCRCFHFLVFSVYRKWPYIDTWYQSQHVSWKTWLNEKLQTCSLTSNVLNK